MHVFWWTYSRKPEHSMEPKAAKRDGGEHANSNLEISEATVLIKKTRVPRAVLLGLGLGGKSVK